MNDDTDLFLPLSPATLHILLALAGGDQHGYGIMKEVARQSEGQYKLGPGTLYLERRSYTSTTLRVRVRRHEARALPMSNLHAPRSLPTALRGRDALDFR